LSEDKLKTFFHGHSYTGNPIVCAAANASLELLQTSEFQLQNLIEWQTELSAYLKSNPKIENLRQTGTIVAFDVKTDANSNYFNNLRDVLYDNFLERGILLRPLGNTVYVLPPYIISKEQLQKVYKVIGVVLEII
jgi:adenosylmethionine-8-amino-7-oxononanoate aminotransferase